MSFVSDTIRVAQGIRSRPSLRSRERNKAPLETGDGRKLPQHLASELNRLHRRLVLARELICELDTERDELLAATSGDAVTTKVTAPSEIYGIGDNFAAVQGLVPEQGVVVSRIQVTAFLG